jgi:2-polyprenyl-6-hydroxyphenyl methylase/3-demethylubiquinone-9 3-methyltransferase
MMLALRFGQASEPGRLPQGHAGEFLQLHATKCDGGRIDVQHATVCPEQPEQFDVVTCLEMLEHVPDPHSVVEACAKLVKPGGWVFLSTLNRNPKSYLFAILGAEYVLNMLPRGTHDYARFIKPSELAQTCRNTGLSVVDLTGMSYNPLSKTYSLGNDTSVNYMIACRRD